MALTITLGLDLARNLLGQPSYWEEKAAEAEKNAAIAAQLDQEAAAVKDRDH